MAGNDFRLIVHNVGHGQSVHAFAPSGHSVVVDLGRSDEFSPLRWLRKSRSSIDLLVVTHPHGDHIDEITLLDPLSLRPRQLIRPRWLTRQEVVNANQSDYSDHVVTYLALSDSSSYPIPEEQRVGNPAVTGGLTIATFFSSECGRSNINNHSGVVVFEYLGVKVVVPGDNESPSWRALLEKPAFQSAIKGADVFVASHHGRTSGYCPELFDVFKPRLCVVSDGRVQDTDATIRYSGHARGWAVDSRSGTAAEQRYCLTTRTDGFVDIRVGQGTERPFLAVTSD